MTLTGTDFTGATGVTIGGVSATSVVVTNATTITCTTPAGTAGTASVLVTTPGGTNAANTLYTYVAPPPTLASLSPASGVTAGGTSVTLTGTNFTGATDVTIGGAAATSVVVVNDTTLTATTPAGTAGTASVLVTTPGGTNAANTLFTYYDVVASYTTGTEVPVTAAGYTATGKTVALSLNFAPTPGTELQVVNNTAPVAFITGRFSNLAQGQVVYLDYAGNSYKFVAHYYGGTGNDLVLVWGKTRLYSWGNNNNGALGNGSTGGTALAPQAVLSNSSVDGKTILATAAGSSHSVALLSDGTLVSWGFNSSNQLGDGTSTSRYYPVPVTVTGTALAGKTVVAVAAGSNHTLVLCSDGTLAAWGGNSNGQLGDNSTTNRSTAVAVLFTGALSGKTVVQIGAGSSYSQVLCSDGTVVSWGNNGSGAFGNGSNTHSQVPVAMTQTGVLNGKSVTRIAPGNSFTMVVCSDGTVACSGYNYDGQMGNGTSGIGTDAYSPVLVTTSGVLSGKTVVEASSGSVFAGVVCSDGTVATWGYFGQVNGRLGDNTSNKSRVPVLVNSANGVSALFGKTPTRLALNSAWRAIAMCSDGSFACWGDSPGDNTSNTRLAPVALYLGNLAANEKILSTVSGPSASHYLAIVGAPLAPAISVLGNSVAIANGSSATSSANFTSLGGLAAGSAGTVTRTFTISSTGENPLNLSGTPKVSLSGADAADFSVTEQPSVSQVAAGASTTFQVTYTAAAVAKTSVATLTITSDDPDDATFSFTISGYATGSFTADFNAATDVPLSSSLFTAAGSTLSTTLNFAPPVGTNLTVVNNTGAAFIAGEFSNVANGSTVNLTYNSVTYAFIAWYYGGDGNDLQLLWPNTGLAAWGLNSSGQLGDTTTTQRNAPVTPDLTGVLAGKTIVQVVRGVGHTLALTSEGKVYAWGANSQGQLGDNTTTQRNAPVAVNTASGVSALFGKTVTAVAAGSYHSLALCSDGTVAAWGYNGNGQLGDNTTTQRNAPVAVNTTSGVSALFGKTVTAVAAGNNHSLALCSDGTLAAWGNNAYGQLGDNTTTQRPAPVAVNTASGVSALFGKTVTAIALGAEHSLALCSDGTLAVWGRNSQGQLGDNTTTQRNAPVAVNTASGVSALFGKTVTAIAAGSYHSLALCSDGTVAAWGYNGNGQLGDNTTTQRNAPVAVNTTSGVSALFGKTVTAVAAGNNHSLALCSDGTLAAWGNNAYGQLGDNTTTQRPAPVAVNTASGVSALFGKTVTAIALGAEHSLALCSDGTLAVWGRNSQGQLGDNTTTQRNAPVAVNTASGVSALFGKTVTSVAAGNNHSLALCSDGTVAAWSNNTYGQLGDNTTTQRPAPVAVNTASGTSVLSGVSARALSTGPLSNHSLALYGKPLPPVVTSLDITSGSTLGGTSVTITGTGFTGATAVTFGGVAATNVTVVDATTITATTPGGSAGPASVVVSTAGGGNAANALFTYTAASLTAAYSSAADVPLTAAGPVAAGGTVSFSLNFAPSPGTELRVVNNTAPRAFITGRFSNLAQGQVVDLDYAGDSYKFVAHYYGGTGNDLVLVWAKNRIFSWGPSSNGALGSGDSNTSRLAPLAVVSNSSVANKTVLATSAGANHSVALLSDGTLVAWGYNSNGQLGDGTTTHRYVPAPVTVTGTALAGKTVVAVAAGENHTLVLCSDGTMAAWGLNNSGELGDNSTTTRTTAVAVQFTGALSGKSVVQIGAGSGWSQVLCSDGTVVSWGNNGQGQFGNGTSTSSQVPVAMTQTGVLNGKSVTSLAMGRVHSMVLCSDGTVAGCGYNFDGQVGNGSSGSNVLLPSLLYTSGVLSGKTVVGASSGYAFAGVVCSDGTVATWGYNLIGQLGDNTTTNTIVPVLVNRTNGVSSLFNKTPTRLMLTNQGRALVLCSDGTYSCWGQGGPGDNTSNSRPASVSLYLGNLAANEKLLSAASGNSAYHYLGIVGSPQTAGISVLGNSVAIANGSSATSSANFTSLGGLAAGSAGTVTRTFTISSTGENPLNLSGTPKVSLSGADAADFAVTAQPSVSQVAPGASTTFEVTYTVAAVAKTSVATLSITSDDPDDATFSFTISGYATGSFTADFNAATDVPLSSSLFTAAGSTLSTTLNFAPPAGTNLTVLNNTGLGFISGEFDGLANGATVNLSYGGVTYPFVAWYYGGDGNDLVLLWYNTGLAAWGNNGSGQLGDNTTTQRNAPVTPDLTGVLAGKTIVQVVRGVSHTLALTSEGKVYAWGANFSGQLGDNTTTQRNAPVAVNTASGVSALFGKTVTAIAAGNYQNLALCSDGTVAAWGYNGNGQLGDTTTTQRNAPVAVNTASGVSALFGKTVTAIALGAEHSLALCSDGTVAAWGYNGLGGLGDNTTTQRTAPVAVNTASGVSALFGKTVTAIAGGSYHSLARCSDGTVAAWGYNGSGGLGDTTTTQRTAPVAVNTATGVSALFGKTVMAIAGGSYHSLALCSDGTVAAWGTNGSGQLGDTTTTQRTAPVAVNTASGVSALFGKTVTAVAGGNNHSLALCSDGTVAAWGTNSSGQLGDTTTTQRTAPVAVNTASGTSVLSGVSASALSTGPASNHSLALYGKPLPPLVTLVSPASGSTLGGTSVTITGIRFTGATAVTFGGVAATNVTVVDATTITATTPGGGAGPASVVVSNANGSNAANALFTYTAASLTAAYSSAADVPLTTAAGPVVAGGTVSFSLNFAPTPGTELRVVNNTGTGPIGGEFDGLANGATVNLSYGGVIYPFAAWYYGGDGNDLVLLWSNTGLAAWGLNSSGQLGDTTTTQRNAPVTPDLTGVLAGKTIVQVVRGANHTLALTSEGKVYAWGNNSSGQLGDTTTTQRNAPVAVNTTSGTSALFGKTVKAIAAGSTHSLALCSDGTVAVWGANGNGQLGDNTTTQRNAPVAVNTASGVSALFGKTVTAVAAGIYHSLALCSDGTVAAWGYNGQGQLGDTTNTQRNAPVAVNRASGTSVLFGKTVTAIAAGGNFSLALCSDGTVAAWGFNSEGQLGDNTTTYRFAPVAVNTASGVSALFGKTVTAIAGGSYHSLALCSDGTVAAWGYNGEGQLGVNTTTQRIAPVAVNTASGVSALFGKTVTAIATGDRHSLARCSDGTVAAWGYNVFGQLGDNTTTNRNAPAAVNTASGTSVLSGVSARALSIGPVSSHSLVIYVKPLPPVVTSLDIASGSTAGGTSVTITGTDFTGATGVTIGGVAATSVVVVNDTTITAVTPAGTAGTASVLVTTPGGTNAANTLFTYVAPLVATYSSATDVPETAAGYTAAGKTVDFTLSYAPATGTNLTVVNNTGTGFVNGTFDNVANGAVVSLTHGGITYDFVAWYYGGDGNDVVLLWRGTGLASWGYNNYGQLGDNSATNRTAPVMVDRSGVLAGKTIVQVVRGGVHTLALTTEGKVYAWGYNGVGELGDNTTTNSSVPVAVNTTSGTSALFGKTVVRVAGGSVHSLALCSDGTLAAWGYNINGQLGDNSTTQRNAPVLVNTASGISALHGKTVVGMSAGQFHSVALCGDGSVVAWGGNDDGQLGDNSTTQRNAPVAVNTDGGTSALSGKTVVAVAAGANHTLALCSDGAVAAWGRNNTQQVGDNGSSNRLAPVLTNMASGVSALFGKTVVALAGGGSHSLALCSDGSVAAWGYNGAGQLGDNTTTGHGVPTLVNTTSGTSALFGKTVVAITAGSTSSMTLCSDGSLVGWGDNGLGQLGDTTTTQRNAPVLVSTANGTSALYGVPVMAPAGGGSNGNHYLALYAQSAAPTVTSLNIASGSTAGGTSVTITGTGFTGATGVTIGGVAATSVVVVNDTTITAVTPAGTAGTASVVVTTPSGSNAANTLYTFGNTAPVITSNGGDSAAGINVAENITTVTAVAATDAEVPATQTLTFTKSGADAALFTLNSSSGLLTFTSAPNFEAPADAGADNVYDVTVTVTDDGTGLLSDAQALSVTVTNVNEAPSLAGDSVQLAYETVNSTRSGSNIVYSVNNAAALAGTTFSRVRYRMELTVAGTPRYAETTFDAWAGLTVADLKVPDGSTPLTIQRNVTNLTVDSNYPGVANATAQTGRLEIWPSNYNQTASGGVGGSSGTFDFDDGGFGTSVGHGSFQVHNLSSGPPQTVFAWNNHGAVNPETGFGNQPTGNPDWTFATLGTTGWKLQISIMTPNLPATFALTEDVTGNLLFAGTPFADDSASLTVTLAVADGVITGNAGTGITVGGTAVSRTFTGTVADLNTYFTTAGKVTYLGALNNDTARTLTTTISDGTFSANTTSTINLAPVNDVPSDITLTPASIAENNATNATVGALSATDPDAGATHTFTKVTGAGDTDNASFTISGSSLRITPSADFETKSSYSVRVQADDGLGGTFARELVVTITDVDDTNANLSSLALSSGTLAPAFSAATTAYTATVSSATSSITVTPTHQAVSATIHVRVNGGTYVAVASGSPSGAQVLSYDANTVDVRVTALDGTTTKTYSVTVTREGIVPVFIGASGGAGTGTGSGVIEAPDSTGTTSVGVWESIRSGAVQAVNGVMAFRGHMEIGSGTTPVTVGDFQGIWKYDGVSTRLLARSGNLAPEADGALFDMLPQNPSISTNGLITFFGTLRMGTGSPAVTSANNMGLWSELGGGAVRLVARKGDVIPGTAGDQTLRTWSLVASSSVSTLVLNAKLSTGSALIHLDVSGPDTLVTVMAEEGKAAPGGGVWAGLHGNSSDPRMNGAGDVAFIGWEMENGAFPQGIYTRLGSTAAGVSGVALEARGGGTAPGTGGATFSAFDRPTVFTGGLAFRGFLNSNGDNADGTKNQGIWSGPFGALVPVVRSGDTNAQIPTVPAGSLVGSIWSPFSSEAGALAFRVSLMTGGTERRAVMGSTGGTMRVIANFGDGAPGLAGETFANFDHPVIGDSDQIAFAASTNAGSSGIWKEAVGGGALSLVLKVGDQVNTSEGIKTVSALSLPGLTSDDRKYELECLDAAGRLLIHVTFDDGTTSLLQGE